MRLLSNARTAWATHTPVKTPTPTQTWSRVVCGIGQKFMSDRDDSLSSSKTCETLPVLVPFFILNPNVL